MQIIISRCLVVTKYSGEEERKIREHFSLSNPDYFIAKKSGRRVFSIPESYYYFYEKFGRIYMSVGCLSFLKELFPKAAIYDKTFFERDQSVKINNKELIPREVQKEAVKASAKFDTGIFKVTTGGGKTILGILLMHAYRCKTLILCDSLSIKKQWVENIQRFMGIKVSEIKGKKTTVGPITISTTQTLSKRREWCKENENYFSMIILDECQGIGPNKLTKSGKGYSYEEKIQTYNLMGRVLQWFNARKKFGMSDGAVRSDGQTDCVYFSLGKIIYETKFDDMVAEKNIIKPKLVVRRTNFEFEKPIDPSQEYTKAYKELISDEERIQLIVSDLIKEKDHFNLILADSIFYLRLIFGAMCTKNPDLAKYACILNSSTPDKKREEYIQKMRDKEINFMFATSLADKGLDVPVLDRFYNTFPGKFEGKKNQQIGRVVRVSDEKDDSLVYDYVDYNIPVYRKQFIYRVKHTYQERCEIDYSDDTIIDCKIGKPR